MAQSLLPLLQHTIQNLCSMPDNTTIIRCRQLHGLTIETHHLRSLLTHNEPTNDAIITLYTTCLCIKYGISQVSTQFITKLKEEGWATVQNYFANNTRAHRRTHSRPYKNGEPVILIPAHVQSCHWVAIVHQEINNVVYFLYADDLNNHTTESEIKHLLQNNTDAEFYPPNAIWITCNSNTYIPHSNECGACTILALHMLSLHPNPHPNKLLPLMGSNIAQIARTWIAGMLASGMEIDTAIHPFLQLNAYNDNRATS